MTATHKRRVSSPADLWVISQGQNTIRDFSAGDKKIYREVAREYRISDLAVYMLNPNPVEVKKKLIGCEIYHQQPFREKVKEKIRQKLPKKLRGLLKDNHIKPEILIRPLAPKIGPLKDKELQSHIDKIYSSLRPYDPIFTKLSQLDSNKLSDIKGITRDMDGKTSKLTLQGSLDEKVKYMIYYILQDVKVIIQKAYLSDGLFDMSGFDFESYNSKNLHRLIQFSHDGKSKACVLDSQGKVRYWIDDVKFLQYMHILEQSIRINPQLNDSLTLCAKGKGKPFKLLFSNQLNIDYSEDFLPMAYREVFKNCRLGLNERAIVLNSLKNFQRGISFNFIPQTGSIEEKLITNISVMHDLKALMPIKDNLPCLYSEMNKRATASEIGKFYLLDSIRGYINGN